MPDNQPPDPFEQIDAFLQQQKAPQTPTPPGASPPAGTMPSTPVAPQTTPYDPRGMIPTITDAAKKYDIDPNIAIKVAQSEGLGNFSGDGGKSGGAFQLYTGGGYGNDFQKETGLDPLDPKNEAATIDYALKRASTEGWGAFHGAANTGINQWDGIVHAAKAPVQPADPFAQIDAFLGTQQPPTQAPADTSILSTAWHGLKAGITDTRQQLIVLHALGDKLLGDENGMRDLMTTYNTLEQEKQVDAPKYNNIKDLYNKGSAGDVLNYVLYNLGEQVPNLALIATGGGLAGFVGKRLGMMAAEGMIDKTAADMLISKYGKRLALAGAYATTAAGVTIPSIAADQYQHTGNIDPGSSITGGLAAAVPGTLGAMALGARFALPGDLAEMFPEAIRSGVSRILGDGWLARRASGALVYGAEAGSAATIQQAVQDATLAYVDQNFKFLGPESRDRILNAAANGSLAGMLFGGITPAHQHDGYITQKLYDAFGVDRKVPGGTGAGAPTPVNDPRIFKIFPVSDNAAVETVMQVLRERLVAAGGYDKLSAADIKFLEDNPHTLESLDKLRSHLNGEISKDMYGKSVEADEGTGSFKVTSAHPDFGTQEVELRGTSDSNPALAASKVVSMKDIPIREMAIRAFDTMNDPKGWIRAPMTLTPEGYVDSKFADMHVGGTSKTRTPADLAGIY